MGPFSRPYIVEMTSQIVQCFGAAFCDFYSGPKS